MADDRPASITFSHAEALARDQVRRAEQEVPDPLDRVAAHVVAAFEAAGDIVLAALRTGDRQAVPSPTVFLHAAARVMERVRHVAALPPAVWAEWPTRTPALQAFDNMHWTGRSSLEVALRMARTVYAAIQFGRSKVTMYEDVARAIAIDPPDENAVRWRDEALRELAEVSIAGLVGVVRPHQFLARRTLLLTDIQDERAAAMAAKSPAPASGGEPAAGSGGPGFTPAERAVSDVVLATLRRIGHPLEGDQLIKAALHKPCTAHYRGILSRMVKARQLRSGLRLGSHRGYGLPAWGQST